MSGLADQLTDAIQVVRCAAALPRILRLRVDPREARAQLQTLFARRPANFLEFMRDAVYAEEQSPYRQLLSLAGCEYGDLERMLSVQGLEATLAELYQAGVYLTYEELRGASPAKRGSASVEVNLRRLANPITARSWVMRSGEKKPIAPINFDQKSLRAHAISRGAYDLVRGAGDRAQGFWDWYVSGTMATMINTAIGGVATDRWFTPVDPRSDDIRRRYVWAGKWVHRLSLLGGHALPAPTFASLEDPSPILGWFAEKRRNGQTPELRVLPSAAVHLADAALRSGTDLEGVWLHLHGEAATPARLRAVTEAGARPIVHYNSRETRMLTGGCLDPEQPDEGHFFHERMALIQPGAVLNDASLTPNTLLFTALSARTAPYVLINASIGDEAVVTHRDCGCALQEAGWTTHMHTIRSYEKLTAGAMSFSDTDVVRAIEETLPTHFGGGSVSYQLVEGERSDGQPDLCILVDPAVGEIDEARLVRTFVEAIGGDSLGDQMMAATWQRGGFLRVERRAPIANGVGKVVHHMNARVATLL